MQYEKWVRFVVYFGHAQNNKWILCKLMHVSEYYSHINNEITSHTNTF